MFELPKRIELQENFDYTFTCNLLSGIKPVTFYWLKNDHKISGKHSQMDQSTSHTSSSLILKEIKRNDSAKYTCTVQNQFGMDSTSIELFLQGLLPFYQPKLN